MEFQNLKRTSSRKKKMMLYIEESLCDAIDEIKPPEITTQEAIRQICQDFITDFKSLDAL